MLGNTGKSIMVRNTLSWKYLLSLTVWTRGEFTSPESKDYVEITGKRMNTSLAISTKSSNKKQKSRFAITDITNKDFKKLLKNLKNSLYLG